MFRLSTYKTPVAFVDGVSVDDANEMRLFFDEIAARSEQKELREASLAKMRRERDENYRQIEIQDYEAYWKSQLWKKIRLRILKRDKRVCERCDGRANQVHHRSYSLEVLRGEDDDQLVSLCDGCHEVVHSDERGHKRAIDEWDEVLFQKDLSQEWPEVKIDQLRPDRWGQKRHPAWRRMTAVQRANWNASLQPKRPQIDEESAS